MKLHAPATWPPGKINRLCHSAGRDVSETRKCLSCLIDVPRLAFHRARRDTAQTCCPFLSYNHVPVPPGDGVIGLPDGAGQRVSFGAITAVCRLRGGVYRPKLGRCIVYGQTDRQTDIIACLKRSSFLFTEDPLQNAG
jgi:hypothetical protein